MNRTIANALVAGARNGFTTTAGVGLGGLLYADQIGLALPSTREQWIRFAISALVAILGVLMKDGVTGSQPPPGPIR